MKKQLILGTAGHIDHGKTSLIHALTGTDTDRLPEEKKRGITIEPGYAHLDLDAVRLGIVDVPGHERFVRQMLAGATGIDIALLVVAADDSIKPQTREHFEILRLLNLSRGVIAITKCDAIDDPDNWLPLVEEEIRELVSGSFLENAPIVLTSAKSRMGIDELKMKLQEAVSDVQISSSRINGPFRMPIDRVFTKEGFGTVVTGSVTDGSAREGDTLRIQPGNHSVRIRSLQNHDSQTTEICRGQRAAVNLAGVHHAELGRGHELCTDGFLRPSSLMFAKLKTLKSIAQPVKDRSRIRFHVGTTELMASVRLIDCEQVGPGESALVQLFLSEKTVAVWNQPFVIRRESPLETLGGGHILHPNATKIRKADQRDIQNLQRMDSNSELERAIATLYFSGLDHWAPELLPSAAGIADPESVREQMLAHDRVIQIKITPTRSALLHRDVLEKVSDQIRSALGKLHDKHPLASLFPLDQINARFSYLPDPSILNWVLNQLQKSKTIRRSSDRIGLSDRGPKLTNNEQKLHDQIVDEFKSAGLSPPTPKELQSRAVKNKDSVPSLLKLTVDNGLIEQIASDLYLHIDTVAAIKTTLRTSLADGAGLTMSEIRSILDTSRKYAVPLCEYLDRVNFTRREGDLRYLSDPGSQD